LINSSIRSEIDQGHEWITALLGADLPDRTFPRPPRAGIVGAAKTFGGDMVRNLVVGLAVCSAVTFGVTISDAHADRASSPVCGASQLRPSFGMSDGAMGTLQDTWRVTNVGAHACHFTGYPTVVNYRNDGRPLPMDISHMGTPHTVVLTHGQHASFDLRYHNPGIIGCTGENPAHMTIKTPGAALPVIVAHGLPSCGGQASESPLRHGD
jgi:hypothetical protein